MVCIRAYLAPPLSPAEEELYVNIDDDAIVDFEENIEKDEDEEDERFAMIRYQLFSLLDIPPDLLRVRWCSRTEHDKDDDDGARSFDSFVVTIAYPLQGYTEVIPEPLRGRLQRVESLRGTPTTTSTSTSQKTPLLRKLKSQRDRAGTAYRDYSAALEVLPHDRLRQLLGSDDNHDEGNRTNYASQCRTDAEERAVLRLLLKWFKREWFTWVDKPPCRNCGATKGQMEFIGVGSGSTPTDPNHRVETYSCCLCRAVTEFPRLNDPSVLLRETRRGRCGEWANAFCLVLRSVGFVTRYILDFTDHVWAEVWLAHDRRWCHLDPCEASLDEPLLYESGWGKKLSLIFAFGVQEGDGVTDVTARYTRKWDEVLLRRREAVDEDEESIRAAVDAVNIHFTGQHPHTWTAAGLDRREREAREFRTYNDGATEISGLGGRTSGDVQWRRARGELGNEKAETIANPTSSPKPLEHIITATTACPTKPVTEDEIAALTRAYFDQLTFQSRTVSHSVDNDDTMCQHPGFCSTLEGRPNEAAVKAFELAVRGDRSLLCQRCSGQRAVNG